MGLGRLAAISACLGLAARATTAPIADGTPGPASASCRLALDARLLLLLAAAMLAGCQTPQTCGLALATTVPLTLAAHGTRMLVPVRLGSRTLSMILDTGAEGTLLSRSSIADVDIFAASGTVRGIGGWRASEAARLDGLQLGRLHGTVMADVVDQVFKVDGAPVDGLLGMSVLGAYDVDIDVPGRQLRLFAPSGTCDTPVAVLDPPIYGVAELPSVVRALQPRVAVSIDGQSFAALIDTGAQGSALFRGAAQRLGLTEQTMQDDPVFMAGGVGALQERAHLHRLDAIEIGDLQLRNVPIAVIDQDLAEKVDMLLGMDFVRRAHLWISASSHSIVLQVPPRPSPTLGPT